MRRVVRSDSTAEITTFRARGANVHHNPVSPEIGIVPTRRVGRNNTPATMVAVIPHMAGPSRSDCRRRRYNVGRRSAHG